MQLFERLILPFQAAGFQLIFQIRYGGYHELTFQTVYCARFECRNVSFIVFRVCGNG